MVTLGTAVTGTRVAALPRGRAPSEREVGIGGEGIFHSEFIYSFTFGTEARTRDLELARRVLVTLSYVPGSEEREPAGNKGNRSRGVEELAAGEWDRPGGQRQRRPFHAGTSSGTAR